MPESDTPLGDLASTGHWEATDRYAINTSIYNVRTNYYHLRSLRDQGPYMTESVHVGARTWD